MENFIVTIFILSFLCILCKHHSKRIIYKQEWVSIKNKMYSSSFQQRQPFPNWHAIRSLHDGKDIIMRKGGACTLVIQVFLLSKQISLDKWNEFPCALQGWRVCVCACVCVCIASVFLPKGSHFNSKSLKVFFCIPEYLGTGTSCFCGYLPMTLVSIEAAI